MEDAIGWASSCVLVCTIAVQIKKQWQSGTSQGVSMWLFVGQLVASLGFSLYSFLIESWVFVVTNGLLSVEAGIGFYLHRKFTHHPRASEQSSAASRGGVGPGALGSPGEDVA